MQVSALPKLADTFHQLVMMSERRRIHPTCFYTVFSLNSSMPPSKSSSFNTVSEVDATAASDYRFMPSDALGFFFFFFKVVVWGYLLALYDYPLSLCWLMLMMTISSAALFPFTTSNHDFASRKQVGLTLYVVFLTSICPVLQNILDFPQNPGNQCQAGTTSFLLGAHAMISYSVVALMGTTALHYQAFSLTRPSPLELLCLPFQVLVFLEVWWVGITRANNIPKVGRLTLDNLMQWHDRDWAVSDDTVYSLGDFFFFYDWGFVGIDCCYLSICSYSILA